MTKPNTLISCLLIGVLMAGFIGCSNQSQPAKLSLEGRWSGFEAGRSELITLAFSSNRFTYWDAQTNELGSGTFLVNEKVQPSQMDLTFLTCPAPDYVGKVGLAIYELQSGELKIAGSEPGSTMRPTNIVGGQGIRVFSFKRE